VSYITVLIHETRDGSVLNISVLSVSRVSIVNRSLVMPDELTLVATSAGNYDPSLSRGAISNTFKNITRAMAIANNQASFAFQPGVYFIHPAAQFRPGSIALGDIARKAGDLQLALKLPARALPR